MVLVCAKCGHENQQGLFCERCTSRLRHPTSYDLTVKNFVTEADERALQILKATGPLLNILYSTVVEPRLSRLTAGIINKTRKSQRIESIATECADILSLDYLPAVHLGDFRHPNAQTTGTESNAAIIVDRQLVEQLSDSELRALLGHEMGHVKSRHLMYHSVAELLERGISFSGSLAGIGLISVPLRLALLSWHRESEISADRAGLIAAGSLDSAVSMFVKIVGELDEGFDPKSDLATILGAFQGHPQHQSRLKAMREFAGSAAFPEVKRRLEHRKMLANAFSETCRFCGASKPWEEVFCPNCQRALA